MISVSEKKYSKEMLLGMYEMMLKIKGFESKAAECFTKGMMHGNIHLCLGQEAVPTGACYALYGIYTQRPWSLHRKRRRPELDDGRTVW